MDDFWKSDSNQYYCNVNAACFECLKTINSC